MTPNVGFSTITKQENKNKIEENTLLITKGLYTENSHYCSVLTRFIKTIYRPYTKEVTKDH